LSNRRRLHSGREGRLPDKPKKPRDPSPDPELETLLVRADILRASMNDAVRRLKELEAEIQQAKARREQRRDEGHR
jgi:hypothetical protein